LLVIYNYSDDHYSKIPLKSINNIFKNISDVFSLVADFINAKCKHYVESYKKGGYCNYIDDKPFSKTFKK